jgi:ubiquinone/menaquinone biosynthesis C-methylase UbiE
MSGILPSVLDIIRARRLYSPPEVETLEGVASTQVTRYWSSHTVNSRPFTSVRKSFEYMDWRFAQYPMFKEFAELYGDHQGEVLMDYGCGPGQDLVGYLEFAGAKRVIGLDVSLKALRLAQSLLALHRIDAKRAHLIEVSDASPRIPLDDSSIDYFQCLGVLQHTTNPEGILAEIRRVLKRGARGTVMVYNRQSIWMHLYTAYDRMIIQGAFTGLDVEEAFARNVDGVDCPIARCYSAEEFVAVAQSAGFECQYVGGYLSTVELDCWARLGQQAITDERLARSHRDFLAGLEWASQSAPTHLGKAAGIGGVYRLEVPA